MYLPRHLAIFTWLLATSRGFAIPVEPAPGTTGGQHDALAVDTGKPGAIHLTLPPTTRHVRDLTVIADRAIDSPEEASARGVKNIAAMTASTGDMDPAQTTDKFLASYPPLFTTKTVTTAEDPDDFWGGNGKEILHLVSKLTDDKNSPNLQQPLLPSLPTSFQQVTSHAPGKANVPDSNPAYRIVFAPGLIVVADAFSELDPAQPAGERVKLNVIAMEFYKKFKGTAPPSDLKWVMRIHIANSLSQACFESVYEANGRTAEADQSDTEWVRWDFTTDRDAVAMLLGTDNGVASTFILQDYKTTLGGRTIVAVYTRRQQKSWALATEYS